MKKHYVLDFDGTLFDVESLWVQWLDLLEGLDIDRGEADDEGRQLFDEGFTCRLHAERMGIDGATVDEIVSQFEEHTQAEALTMVYEDVMPFIERKDADFSILTFGDSSYQHFKLDASGISDVVDDIRIARPERRKSVHLKELCAETDAQIIFIDDNPNELTAVIESGLPVIPVRMMRKGSRHHGDAHAGDGEQWQTVKSLSEIE